LEAERRGIRVVHNVSQASMCIVMVGAMAGEGEDRKSLDVDGESLIWQTAEECPKTVVLMQTPGAVLTPWRREVQAIANMFLGGEETAHAWNIILWGDDSPSGKLPISFPETEDDTIQPGEENELSYTEGTLTSYRSHVIEAAYPFGHGLSYAIFDYESATQTENCSESAACIDVTVRNVHRKHKGKEVVQAYVEFAHSTGEPQKQLRGFIKTHSLEPGESQTVNLAFTKRDLSFYNGGWVGMDTVTVHIGSSSVDIRFSLTVRASF